MVLIPRGLFWNSKESQENRFAILIDLLEQFKNKIDKNIIKLLMLAVVMVI